MKIDKIDKIVEILQSYEDKLSDGYGYYNGSKPVDVTLREIAMRIDGLYEENESIKS